MVLDTLLFRKCFWEAVMVFAKEILNEQLNIFGEANLQAAATVLLFPIDVTGAKQEILSLDASSSLWATQSFPAHISRFLST